MCPLFALLVLGSTALDVRGQSIAEFRANVDLRQDGSVVVAEQLTVEGAPALHRSLPLEYSSGGYLWYVAINVLAVRGLAGNPLTYQTFTRDRHLEITVPLSPPTDQAQSILLIYEVRHAVRREMVAGDYLTLRFIDDHHWKVPIDHVVLTATIPGDPAGGLSAHTNVSTDHHDVVVDGRTVRIVGGPLPAGYWLEMTVQFPHGIVALSLWDRVHQEDSATLAGLLFVTAFLGVLCWYVRHLAAEGRSVRRIIIAPSPVSPAAEIPQHTAGRRCSICNAVLPEGTGDFCPTCLADRKIILAGPSEPHL